MKTATEALLDGLLHECEQARVVIESIQKAKMDFIPAKGMRDLITVANHLAQIPSMDPAIYCMELDCSERAHEMEERLRRDTVSGLLEVFDAGVEEVRRRFSRMTDKELFERNKKPFYDQGPPKDWAFYLSEMTRHIAMHKMQLWMYLRLQGLPVTMMTYYGVKT
ncbi:MAG: hypothetical protein HXY34_10925 [Candidatus Thorarchaeota archaeon]|nr:hypothetical protein [Candidatus Thorarchaeota archaeon]